jgi:hypothetical protein
LHIRQRGNVISAGVRRNLKCGPTKLILYASQSAAFKIADGNTFLVLRTSEPSILQKVIPLGVFELLASKHPPASVMLIRANPAPTERINKETAAAKQ